MFDSFQSSRRFTHKLASLLISLLIVIIISIVESTLEEDEKIPFRFDVESTLPGAIVFNFDELIWQYKVDKVMTPPLSSARNKNEIKDRMGKTCRLFNDTRTILEDLFAKWFTLGGLVISTDPEKVENIMSLYDIERYFKFFEVFPRTPGCKVKHMKRVSKQLKVDLNEILYFDSDEDQLDEVMLLNVTTVQVSPKVGLTYDVMQLGLHQYHTAHNSSIAD